MGMIEDIMKALDRIPIWRRLSQLPAEVEQLRAKVDALEARLAPGGGVICPKCREPRFMLESSGPERGPFGTLGAREYRYRCASCGYEDVRPEPL